MNPMMMQMWIVAFEAYIKAHKGIQDGEDAGYRAALFAEGALKGAQRAARESEAATKLVPL